MKNSTRLIFSILKNLERITFRVLKLGDTFEKTKKKLTTFNDGTVLYNKCEYRIEQQYKHILKLMTIDIENDIFKILPYSNFQRANIQTVSVCKRIYNDIENGYYTHKQLVLSYLHESMFVDKKILIKNLNMKRIKEVKKLYTRKQFLVDKEFISNINSSLNITKVSDYFKINNDGENIIFNLIKKQFISPIFYLYFRKKLLTKLQENIKFNSKEYLHFERLNNIIFKILN